jgi:hypothetical protein
VKTQTAAIETDTQDLQSRLPAALTGAGNIKADALALSGDTTAADNAEAFFDGTGYAGTGNTIPTVTTVTNLTNAPTAGDFTATMKTSIGTAVAASAVASVTGNVGGNVVGSVASVTAGVTVTTNNDKTGYSLTQSFPTNFSSLSIDGSGLVRLSSTGVADITRTAMTESYSTDGSNPTLEQALFEIRQFQQERAISGTTLTVKKKDGSTSAMTFTLNDATTPTSITRAT